MHSQLRKAAAISWKEAPSLESGGSASPEGTCGPRCCSGDGPVLPHGVTSVTQGMSESSSAGLCHGENTWAPWGQGLGPPLVAAPSQQIEPAQTRLKGFLLALLSAKSELLRKGNSARSFPHTRHQEPITARRLRGKSLCSPSLCSTPWALQSCPKHNLPLPQLHTEITGSPRSLSLVLIRIFINTSGEQCCHGPLFSPKKKKNRSHLFLMLLKRKVQIAFPEEQRPARHS